MTGPMRASNWRPLQRNTLRGFFSLTLPSGLVLNECTFHVHENGAEWIGLPARPQLDREGRQRRDPTTEKILYSPIVEIAGKTARERFQATALVAVHTLLREARAA
jgi:hypothetical protein